MKFLRKAAEFVQAAMLVLLVLGYVVFILKMLVEPLAPIITVGLVLLGTVFSFEKRITALLTIGGIFLYAASWPAVEVWGLYWGLSVYTLGVLAWMAGVFRPFPCLQNGTV